MANRPSFTTTHITAKRSVVSYAVDLKNNSNFLHFLIWKELKVRYRNIPLGILWATLQPLVYVLALVFVSRFSELGTNGELPFPLFIFSGVMFWQLFASVVNGTIQMLTSNAGIMNKVYFPKFLVVIASAVVSSIELIPVIVLFILMAVFHDLSISPVFISSLLSGSMTILLAGAGTAGLVSLLVLRWPSIRHSIPLALHILLFICPVLYSLNDQVDGIGKSMVQLIPITGPIELLRGSMQGQFDAGLFSTSLIISALFLIAGLINYVNFEDKAVEHV